MGGKLKNTMCKQQVVDRDSVNGKFQHDNSSKLPQTQLAVDKDKKKKNLEL